MARLVDACLALSLLGVGACHGAAATPDAAPAPDARPVPPAKVDVLFLIDNSSSVGGQTPLVNYFPVFLARLSQALGGLPDLHIAVADSSVGAGGFNIGGCLGSGDDGRFQHSARGTCTPPDGAFIIDSVAADGTRVKNHSDSLENTFTCIAKVGDFGCGFEQHLEGMKRALDGHNAENAGFLRGDAILLIVILGDEDDCSASDGAVFDPSQTTVDSPLGPLRSFRCTEWGVECDGAHITRSAASYHACRARQDSPYLYLPSHYVHFVQGLKADQKKLLVATIVGPSAPVSVTVDSTGTPTLAHACGSAIGSADPAVRINEFAAAFGTESLITNYCQDDYKNTMSAIADLVIAHIPAAP